MSRFENRRWLVIPTSITGSINFNEVIEPNINSLRLSLDGSETFVKYEVDIVTASYNQYSQDAEDLNLWYTSSIAAGTYGRPSIYSDSYNEYTHSEILNILTGSAWVSGSSEV